MIYGHLNTSHWIIIVLSVLLLASLVNTLMIRKDRSALARKLEETTLLFDQLKTDLTELRTEYDRINEFQHNLHNAELTTQLQQTRLHTEEIRSSGNTPEKYRYVRSLSERGMDAEAIASILAISAQEAEQLLALTKIARER